MNPNIPESGAAEKQNPLAPQISNFIHNRIDEDLAAGKNEGRVVTRFPPEPNGYLHIGHAKSICLNFGISKKYQKGPCHLRFDDTNPEKESQEYIDSIKRDVAWLGFSWGDNEYYASDYFEQLYGFAEELIKKDLAYVCQLNPEELRQYRGTLTEPGKDSPYRNRSVEENLSLFKKMRGGGFKDGEAMLRAKINMASGNLNMRDPVLYRVKHVKHHRTGDKWCIYPMYDFTHCLSDAIEKITHSICTLEFEDHRPLYDWVIDNVNSPSKPQQIEFARLNLTQTLMSKRKLLALVENKWVEGWDDPRMPTISGLRRRGYTPDSIRVFCEKIGVAKRDSTVDMALLESCIREELNQSAPRLMAVLRPLKIVLENYPDGEVEFLEAQNNPEDPEMGSRKIPFGKTLYIEQDDFMENPPKKYFRLTPGGEVRLRYGYVIYCKEAVKNPDTGEILHLICSYDPQTRGGKTPDGRKVKGTLHWVSESSHGKAEVRLLEPLLLSAEELKAKGEDLSLENSLNPNSMEMLPNALVEPSLLKKEPGFRCQFERLGYFYLDKKLEGGKPLFHRTVSLKDSWGKMLKSQKVS